MAEAISISRFGYSVLSANTGESAVAAALGDQKIDLILMDIDLGSGIDGTETARRILAERRVPIVFLTSHSEREMVEKVKGITRYGYMIKNAGDFVLRSTIEMAFELFDAHETTIAREAELEAIYENAPVIMMLLDTDRRVRKTNEYSRRYTGAAAAVTGLRPGNVLNCINSFSSSEGCGYGVDCADCIIRKTLEDTLETGSSHEDVSVSWSLVSNSEPKEFQFLLSAKMLRIAETPMLMATLTDITERKKAVEELQRSERRAHLLNSVAKAFLTVSDEAVYEEVLKIVLQAVGSKCGLFGYFSDNGNFVVPGFSGCDWAGRGDADKDLVFSSASLDGESWAKAILERRTVIGDGPFITSKGRIPCGKYIAVPVVFEDAAIGLLVAVNQASGYQDDDIKILEFVALFASPILKARLQRDKNERRVVRVNRSLRMLSEANQTLIHATEESSFLKRLCDIIVETGGYVMATVGFAERDERRSVRIASFSGNDSGYLAKLDLSWGNNERGRGPAGTAIRTGTAWVARNIPTDPFFAPWREEAIKRGYQSTISLPLKHEEEVFGFLGVYSVEEDAFDSEEMDILSELANDLAFGIMTIRT